LEDKQNYNPQTLLEKIKNTWMKEETILLLVQEKKYEQAIEMYVNEKEFEEAENFCSKKSKSDVGLMTTLLKIYFSKYTHL